MFGELLHYKLYAVGGGEAAFLYWQLRIDWSGMPSVIWMKECSLSWGGSAVAPEEEKFPTCLLKVEVILTKSTLYYFCLPLPVKPVFLKAPGLSGEKSQRMWKSLQCLNIFLVTAICAGWFDTVSLCFIDLSFHGYLEVWVCVRGGGGHYSLMGQTESVFFNRYGLFVVVFFLLPRKPV